jgi:hypothetical protein
MKDLQWMLELEDSTPVQLREDVAEELELPRHTTVGAVRPRITPKPKQPTKMIEVEDDFNMEL